MPVQTLLHTTGSTMSSEMNTGSQSRAIHTSASTTNDATGVDLTTVMSGRSSASAVFDTEQATAMPVPSATAAVMPSSTRPMDTAVMRQNAAVAAERKSQIGSGDRSERVRTYNFPQNRVTDHRLSGDNKNFNIQSIINGNLDPLIDCLVTADQAAKLQAQTEA